MVHNHPMWRRCPRDLPLRQDCRGPAGIWMREAMAVGPEQAKAFERIQPPASLDSAGRWWRGHQAPADGLKFSCESSSRRDEYALRRYQILVKRARLPTMLLIISGSSGSLARSASSLTCRTARDGSASIR